jgi:Ca2+-transporting ATPase
MVTGDFVVTAQAIAQQAGFERPAPIVTGAELARMNRQELAERVQSADVFARILPEQKLLLVEALKASGEVVGMTGDRVNDAPALKAADIGVAMAARGTDVAREAADLVLLDDSFASILHAARLGRRIYDNLRKAMHYVVAMRLPIACLALLPIVLHWPLLLMPLHVVFLELIIDPACSLVFEAEPEEADAMQRPPRDPEEPLFTRRSLSISLLEGASVTAVVFGVFAIALARGDSEPRVRAVVFTTLMVANLALILTGRSWSRTILGTLRVRSPALWWVVGGAIGILAFVLFVSPVRAGFYFSRLHGNDLVLSLGAGIASVSWFEVLKLIRPGWARRESARG